MQIGLVTYRPDFLKEYLFPESTTLKNLFDGTSNKISVNAQGIANSYKTALNEIFRSPGCLLSYFTALAYTMIIPLYAPSPGEEMSSLKYQSVNF